VAGLQAQEEDMTVAPTRPFSDTIRNSLQDADCRRAFLGEALAFMTTGDVETGKIVLREYVNGTVGFVKLGAALGKSPKSLMRMLSPTGNPHLTSFFQIVAYLQKIHGIVLTVQGIAA
jgi:DNA-binding phage protein